MTKIILRLIIATTFFQGREVYATMNYEDFIQEARTIQTQTGVPASITLGQLLLESGNNFSSLAKNYKNLFGIKGEGTAGSVYLPTTEYKDGKAYTTTAKFAAYESYYDSLLDHAKLLQSDRYTSYTKSASNYKEYANAIQKAGYATDPDYAKKLIQVIESNKLYQYDKEGYFLPQNFNKTIEKYPFSISEEKEVESTNIFSSVIRVITLFVLAAFSIFFLYKAFPNENLEKIADVAIDIATKKGVK